jgi:hypothetical protein
MWLHLAPASFSGGYANWAFLERFSNTQKKFACGLFL